MLTRATFANYKALRNVTVDLTQFTVIVGKNGTGKTSVLEAIDSLTQVPRSGSLAFTGAHDPRRVASRPRTGAMRLAMTDTHGQTFSLEAHFDESDDGKDAYRLVAELSGDKPIPLSVSPQAQEDDPDVWGGLAASASDPRRLLRPAAKRFGSAVLLRLDARVMTRESIASTHEPRLEFDGAGLATVLAAMAGSTPEVLDEIRRDLTKVVPQVRGIRTFPASVKRRQHQRVMIDDQAVHRTFDEVVPGHRFALDMGRGRVIEADLLSEGTVLALGLLTALRHPRCPRLVLLDDIDAALHSAAQAELVRAIRSILAARPEVQIICTSHSPDLLDNVTFEEIRVMALDRDGYAKCARLSDHPESGRWSGMLRTGEFWSSVGEDWLVEDPVDGK